MQFKKRSIIIFALLLLLSVILGSVLALRNTKLSPAVPTAAPYTHKPKASPTPLPTPTPTPIPTPSPTPVPTPTPKPISPEVLALIERDGQIKEEKKARGGMKGRLLIPSVGIDVALITDSGGSGTQLAEERQLICDLEDSALVYSEFGSVVVADHNNQGFLTLANVFRGDKAYMLFGGRIVTLECSIVFDGINTGMGVTDIDGTPAPFYAECICYTCGVDWQNVRVVGFEQIDEDVFEDGGEEKNAAMG